MYLSFETIGFLTLSPLQIWTMKKAEDASTKRKPKTSAAQIRVQKGAHMFSYMYSILLTIPFLDLTELDLPSTMQTHFSDPSDLLNFTLTITPDEGKC
jgi:ubiquitin-conjugating enzyme E2 M